MIFKKIMIFLGVMILPVILFAQAPEPAIAKVYYKFSHQYDTTNTNKVKTETYILLIGKNASVYKSYDRIVQDSEMLANFKLTKTMMPPSGKRASSEELYFFFNTRKFYMHSRTLGNYVVTEPFDDLNWQIEKETKKIENIPCQKATASYKGRKYIAWFTTEYPFKAGPWKLHGLPGLIISAADVTGRIRFDFVAFEHIANPPPQIVWDSKAIMITPEDYQKVAKAMENDPKGMIETMYHVKLTTSQPLQHRNLLAPNPSVNFPLEVEK